MRFQKFRLRDLKRLLLIQVRGNFRINNKMILGREMLYYNKKQNK